MGPRETNPNFMNGVPELLILRLLAKQEMYGYEIVQAIRYFDRKQLADVLIHPNPELLMRSNRSRRS